MPKPSIYKQLAAVQVAPGPFTPPSPRHWNPGLLRYKGRLWLAFRYHLGREHASRCATGLVPIDKKTFQPTGLFQHLNLPGVVGDEHFEDARLFMFRGQPHISYVQMTGYRPGVDFKCHIKYARLKLLGNRWIIEEVFWPKFGQNHGGAKEKNWSFFECGDELHAIYEDRGSHKVIKLDGDKITAEYESPAPWWPWGIIRGGAPPVPMGDGKLLVFFHSSLATEEAPHYIRYYGAAYVMDDKPPFTIRAISSKPMMAGSEADGHGYDPRYAEGWKPYVVFPAGCVPDGDEWLVSFGVNDWQCGVGRVTREQMQFILPDGSDMPTRYFMTVNGSLPVQITGSDGIPRWIPWEIFAADRRGAMAPSGYYATKDGREAEVIADAPRVEEITAERYHAARPKIYV